MKSSQPLAARVLARKDELEDVLADLGRYDQFERQAIVAALSAAYHFVTGDLVHPSEVLGRALNRWLESNKHLGHRAGRLRDYRVA